ncbi:hypothetical protein MYBA111488_24600 [Mycobacterium basiliense]
MLIVPGADQRRSKWRLLGDIADGVAFGGAQLLDPLFDVNAAGG